jgi:16S rRNA (uracil1498-N3)-methyltransferase
MHRFFLEPGDYKLLPGTQLYLPDKLAHQVRDVLHLTVGESLILLDNSGDEIHCTVQSSTKAGVEVIVNQRQRGKSESLVQIMLCPSLLKSARFEWILEKGTELGVTTFAPTYSCRSMAGLQDAGTAKIQRWQRILQEATEQCGRARQPILLPIRSFSQMLANLPAGAILLMPWEEVRALTLRDALRSLPMLSHQKLDGQHNPLTIVICIGPEGGFDLNEVQLARQYGAQIVSLGPRIMRAETAALAAVAAVMYELESWIGCGGL